MVGDCHVPQSRYSLFPSLSCAEQIPLMHSGAAVTSIFGPTLLRGFGFDVFRTTLLTMPFGALQSICILIGCYCAYKVKFKSLVLNVAMLFVVAGCAMIFSQASNPSSFNSGVALGGYYLMATLFAANPLIVSWLIA